MFMTFINRRRKHEKIKQFKKLKINSHGSQNERTIRLNKREYSQYKRGVPALKKFCFVFIVCWR